MKLEVIGGLGPLATACFLEMVTEMTDASRDQDHLEMIIYSVPWIPDRTDYILGRSQDSPIDPMIEIGRKLAGEQVSCIAIPCMTAHYFYRELSERIPVPIVHGIYETGMEIQKNHIEKVGLMATDGTIRSRIFQEQLENMGLKVLLPDEQCQQYVMDVIYKDVKAGRPAEEEKFREASRQLTDMGAQVILLGCTELSLVKRQYSLGKNYLDAMEVLAQRSVVRCGKKLKKEYENLLAD